MSARTASPSEFDRADQESFGAIESCVVGWDGDSGDHFDNDKSASDGTTLVKVTIRRSGHQTLVRTSSAIGWQIPTKGTEVMVAFPAGYGDKPGAGVILTTTGASPRRQSGNRIVLDFGDQDVIITGRKVVLQTKSGHFLSMSDAGGIKLVTKEGTGITLEAEKLQAFAQTGGSATQAGDVKSVLLLDGTSAELQFKGGGSVVLDSKGTSANGANVNCCGANVFLGAKASALTPVTVGPVGQTAIGSLSVFCSP